MEYKLRLATLEDVPALRELIARSIHGLGAADYTPAQIEAALQGAFGVDTVLIRDGTYFVAETPTRDIVACGGWGRRRTLFGSDARAERDESWLNPKTDAAKIRAFFVDPAHARHGIGRAILARPGGDFPARIDDESRRRSADEPPQAVDHQLGAALFERAGSGLERIEDLRARDGRQEPLAAQEIEQLAPLSGRDPAIGGGDQSRGGDHGVQ